MRENGVNCTNLELTEKFVLFGVLQNVLTDKVLDLIVMLAKFCFYKCKRQETAPNLNFYFIFSESQRTGILWKDIYILLQTNYMILPTVASLQEIDYLKIT